MKINTSELIGPFLDCAVAIAKGLNYRIRKGNVILLSLVPCPDGKPGCCVAHYKCEPYNPSTNWAQGGPIIDQEDITVGPNPFGDGRAANKGDIDQYGRTNLIAGMRCFVTSRLGDEVEIPNELFDTTKHARYPGEF